MLAPNRRPRLRALPINKMIPNMVTLLALAAGLTSIRYGLRGEFERAVVAIILAGILDGLDGRIARMLRGTTKFGAELDSLSDFLSFGVAPAMLLYLWTMNDAGGLGWALVLLFATCSALRLARFNTMLGEPEPPAWSRNYFVGVPAPAAAFLALLPMMLSFQLGPTVFAQPVLVAVFMVGVGLLMVSRMPTYSFKRVQIPRRMALPLMIVVGLLAAFLVTNPWTTLSVVGLVYLATLPLAWRSYHRLKAKSRLAELEEQGSLPLEPGTTDGTVAADAAVAPDGAETASSDSADRPPPSRS
ncbi:CDP-diacylglycerol--serine O-phosphatidyltransferase [Caenispirillum bisanense]|uniref:CDP-diacylglycerol--serine O-phosphatidyltransferase n=1 Tax=Caenispirillum bisanense TaxID=414052 RepID=UPI0031DE927A